MPFWISPGFQVIPALGPLTLGHSMVVAKEHAPSLLTMDAASKREFLDVCKHLIEAWDGEPLVFAEHGSSSLDSTGPCIAHAHANLIPGAKKYALDLEGHGHELLADGELLDLPTIDESYFLIGQPDAWRVYNLNDAPSQHLRMLLFEAYGLPHWDWRLFPNERLAADTHTYWHDRLTSGA